MIESVQFKNFKALRDATLPLGRFTLIVGPNGSGKSTALQGLQGSRDPGIFNFPMLLTLGEGAEAVEVILHWGGDNSNVVTTSQWLSNGNRNRLHGGSSLSQEQMARLNLKLERIRFYSLDADQIAEPVQIMPKAELQRNGAQLAAVLDRLDDDDRDRFNALNQALSQLMPEFDSILFETVEHGKKTFALRTRRGYHKVSAKDLSQGERLTLALLTLAYLPNPPSLLCLEEPDRGIHPRLLRDVQAAIYRLSYPEDYGENREPVQVIATTHSPYFLDLFRDHPEEVVIADKTEQGTQFKRLSDHPNLDDLIRDAHLGDIWYTGIFGGVPARV